MTPTEREELLRLWEDVPETEPKGLRVGERGAWWCDVEGQARSVYEPHAAAIARDAMVGWMVNLDHMPEIRIQKMRENETVWFCISDGPVLALYESYTLALIHACRRLAEKP